jgi:hypothetical protein
LGADHSWPRFHRDVGERCSFSRDGAASELLDIFAHYADVPRGDRRFDKLAKTSAIILRAERPNVRFAQVIQLRSKIFLELTEN